MTDEELKKEVEQIKQMKQEIPHDYNKLDKSYSRNMIRNQSFF